MKLHEYKTFSDIEKAANSYGLKLYKTSVSYSFRIFNENGMTIELHIYKYAKI